MNQKKQIKKLFNTQQKLEEDLKTRNPDFYNKFLKQITLEIHLPRRRGDSTQK